MWVGWMGKVGSARKHIEKSKDGIPNWTFRRLFAFSTTTCPLARAQQIKRCKMVQLCPTSKQLHGKGHHSPGKLTKETSMNSQQQAPSTCTCPKDRHWKTFAKRCIPCANISQPSLLIQI
jgi:hypothetical protein